MPRRWGLMGKGPADSTPPTLSAPLYRLNHSMTDGGTGEPRELVRCVGQRARSTPPPPFLDPAFSSLR
jgi:hypothetical protein